MTSFSWETAIDVRADQMIATADDIAKDRTPIERVFGFTLLGSGTVSRLSFYRESGRAAATFERAQRSSRSSQIFLQIGDCISVQACTYWPEFAGVAAFSVSWLMDIEWQEGRNCRSSDGSEDWCLVRDPLSDGALDWSEFFNA